MNLCRPFIELYKLFDSYYIYDVNSNQIAQVSQRLYEQLKTKKIESIKDEEVLNEVKILISKGLLCNNPIQHIEHPATDFIDSYLSHCSSLTLQTTQLCNFKCRYCSYASDTELDRSHSHEYMSIDTVIKSIDFFYDHSIEESNINICFYGGEPLLNLAAIEAAIEYAEKKFYGKNITYLITTNGSIVSKRILDLFDKYNFVVTVSLDGPKSLHDKNRRFSYDGGGTYNTVLKNILCMKNSIVDYKNKVQINAVLDPEENYVDYIDYFSTDFPIKDIPIHFSLLDSSKLKYSVYPGDKFISNEKLEKVKKYLRILLGDKGIDLESTLNDIMHIADSFKPTRNLHQVDNPAGTCIPGYIKLFIMQNGDILPCEKVSENSCCMKLGNIYSGFDHEKVREFINIGQLTAERCASCSAIRHCTICPRQIDDINDFNTEYKHYRCRFAKKEFHDAVIKYIIYAKCGIFEAVSE